ncbi:MAG TPA: ATP-binding cassette domain-containing protein [Thermoanaerobaculia bacterium]|nr:ATP-binding cassette domain-containing protein [Thermoanaerobaculia bacterium]
MEPRLQLIDVRKAYGDFLAVDGVSLEVPPGTIFGLLGPNGAGKTTTLRMILDIIAPDSGEIRLFGRTRRPEDLDRIGYLPEERGLYRKMTAVEHLAFLGQLHGLGRKESIVRAGRWLERLGLGDRTKSKVEELSKGMQQKLQLAGTVLHDPEVVILDEPFSGLDPINQGLFKDVLAEFKAEGRTILFSTHVMEQAEKLCDHICLLSRGRAILEGELGAIKRRLGGNSYRIVADGDPAAWTRVGEIPGVEAVVPGEGEARVLLAPEAEGPQVLRELTRFLAVREFRSREPDLEEIFIKAVGDAA